MITTVARKIIFSGLRKKYKKIKGLFIPYLILITKDLTKVLVIGSEDMIE